MASLTESVAHFKARASEYGVPDEVQRAFGNAGIHTMGHLAFGFSRPGQDFEENKFVEWITTINGGTVPSVGTLAAIRRLHFEAEVILTASLKAAVEHPGTDRETPKPLPFAERNARMAQLRIAMPGLNLDGPNEPSQALIDEACHQYESRTLRYIEPGKCNSREAEVLTGRTEKKLKFEAATLSIKETKNTPDEDTSTMYNLHQCLKRRAVAYEFANLISFVASERYIAKLMKRLSTEPPPMYQATTLTQVLRADREVFLHMTQNVTDIRPNAAGLKPLDAALDRALEDYNTAFHLVPLPKEQVGPLNSWRSRADPSHEGSDWKDAKGKGKKGKGKFSSGSNAAPKGMIGCVGRDAKQRPICFDFNLSQCRNAPTGGVCKKGRHVCFKAGCFKPHQFHKEHAAEMPAKE